MELSFTKDEKFPFVYIKDTKVLFFGHEKQMIQKNSVLDLGNYCS